MLLNSAAFLFIFLPLTIMVYYFFYTKGLDRSARVVLILSSIIFYALWSINTLWILAGLILVNFIIAKEIAKVIEEKRSLARNILISGVFINLVALGYFKYFHFIAENVSAVFKTEFSHQRIVMPLGISYITFQFIAYLVDVYKKQKPDTRFSNFTIFISFFPKIIAGPILRYSDLNWQLKKLGRSKINWTLLRIGVVLFIIGLAKKVLLADSLEPYVATIFSDAESGQKLNWIIGWAGTLAFTLQIYFDFSGYSDMAVGLGLLFGLRLPENFDSPYKALSITEFWRRWHMTLSSFLKDYIYIPLGGNKRGEIRRHFNVFVTMLVCGIWHGAGWNFIIWGGIHGIFIIVNNIWKQFRGNFPKANPTFRYISALLTFFCVTVAWVFFRASTLQGAMYLLKSMFSIQPLGWEQFTSSYSLGLPLLIGMGLSIVWLLPNSLQISKYSFDITEKRLSRQNELVPWLSVEPSFRWALVFGFLLALIIARLPQATNFIYAVF
jgi:D-alanyl-lipoteichoic acid acyltransferase DltB (MBOAT superfamily)